MFSDSLVVSIRNNSNVACKFKYVLENKKWKKLWISPLCKQLQFRSNSKPISCHILTKLKQIYLMPKSTKSMNFDLILTLCVCLARCTTVIDTDIMTGTGVGQCVLAGPTQCSRIKNFIRKLLGKTKIFFVVCRQNVLNWIIHIAQYVWSELI